MKLKVTKTKNLVGAAIYKIYPTDLMISNQNAHNTADIEFELPEEWQGLTIRVTFIPNGKPPIEMLIVDNVIKLNSDITSENGVLVIDAYNDNLHYYATDCRYIVARHSNVGGSEPEYTPTQIEQILAQTQAYTNSAIEAKNEAVEAKEQAETASQYADNVKVDIDNEKSNIENFVEESKRTISSQTTDSVNTIVLAGTESVKNASRAIEQQTAISIKSIEDKSAEEQQAISEFVGNEAQQIVSDSKVEIANETNLSKTEISDFTLLNVQRIEQKAEEKLAEINADETVQKVNELVRDFPKKLTQPETASVGQIFKVKSINDDGTLSLEAVDMPSGGGGTSGGNTTGTPVWETLAHGALLTGTEANTHTNTGLKYSDFNEYSFIRIAIVASTNTGTSWSILPDNDHTVWKVIKFTEGRGGLFLTKLVDNYWQAAVRNGQKIEVINIYHYAPFLNSNFMGVQSDQILKFIPENEVILYNNKTTNVDATWYVQGLKVV